MTADQLVRAQKQADRDDFLNAIAAWVYEARQATMPPPTCFPKYLYLNSRVWEDSVGPALLEPDGTTLLDTLGIEVRHSPAMPEDVFHLTADPYPIAAVAAETRQNGALPAHA